MAQRGRITNRLTLVTGLRIHVLQGGEGKAALNQPVSSSLLINRKRIPTSRSELSCLQGAP